MRIILFLSFILVSIASCKQIDIYEKLVDLPQHEWKRNQHVVIPFKIADSSQHQLFFVVRHTQRYPFNRLIVKLFIEDSARKIVKAMQVNAPLTDSAHNWSGIAMDDLYYSRIRINPPVSLNPGTYRFVLEHAMKEETLPEVLNIGLALDK